MGLLTGAMMLFACGRQAAPGHATDLSGIRAEYETCRAEADGADQLLGCADAAVERVIRLEPSPIQEADRRDLAATGDTALDRLGEATLSNRVVVADDLVEYAIARAALKSCTNADSSACQKDRARLRERLLARYHASDPEVSREDRAALQPE